MKTPESVQFVYAWLILSRKEDEVFFQKLCSFEFPYWLLSKCCFISNFFVIIKERKKREQERKIESKKESKKERKKEITYKMRFQFQAENRRGSRAIAVPVHSGETGSGRNSPSGPWPPSRSGGMSDKISPRVHAKKVCFLRTNCKQAFLIQKFCWRFSFLTIRVCVF